MQLNDNTQLHGGKYRIIRVLGQGGFGITYLADYTTLNNIANKWLKDMDWNSDAKSMSVPFSIEFLNIQL